MVRSLRTTARDLGAGGRALGAGGSLLLATTCCYYLALKGECGSEGSPDALSPHLDVAKRKQVRLEPGAGGAKLGARVETAYSSLQPTQLVLFSFHLSRHFGRDRE